jgi:hypothetical protein
MKNAESYLNYLKGSASGGAVFGGIPRWSILAFAITGMIIWAIMEPPEMFQAPPNGPFAIADIERQFSDDPDAAMKRYQGRPLLVDGVVASMHRGRLTLKSIYALDVQTEMFGGFTPVGDGSPIRLRCTAIARDDYLNGAKPRFRDCRVVDD